MEEIINSLIKLNKTTNTIVKEIIRLLFSYEEFSIKTIKNYILEQLYPNLSEQKESTAKNNICSLLNTNVKELRQWYNYLNSNLDNDILYHTYHGTKGLEFDNVLIIMSDKFGKQNHYFSQYFTEIQKVDISNRKKLNNSNVQNLLYVSCSRSVQNLRIAYIDNISNYKNGIEKLFGKVMEFKR